MKFQSSGLVFLLTGYLSSSVQGFHPSDDIYFHTKKALGASMWHFSPDGLKIFNPAGSILKAPPKSQTCETYESTDSRTNVTETVDSCRYFSFSTDGHRYVWAGGRSSSDRVEAFDIDTGDRVGYTSTCRVPMDLDYHPGRREMIVHCHTAELDVFSVHALGVEHNTIDLETGGFPAGRLMVHSTMGSSGYSGNSAFNGLIEVDLADRKVKAFHELPLANDARTMAYSAVNHHIYVRPRMCCTCGSEGADVPSCGRGDPRPVNVVTGPNQGTGVSGVCGGSCEGGLSDTIGVYEFDTIASKVVGSHNIDPSKGHGANPAATPDGRYALLFGADGGESVIVLKPGENGQVSTKIAEISVGFKGGLPGDVVVSDFAHVSDESRNVLILGASTDNDIVLIDMDKNFRMTKLALTNAGESTGGRERQIEWAVGTDYVWVTGGDAGELYIVELPTSNIDDAKVVKTIGGITSGDLIFVENYERKAAMQAMHDMIMELDANVATDQMAQAAFGAPEDDDDDGGDDMGSLEIATLIVALISLIMSFVAILKVFSPPPPTPKGAERDTDADTNAALETKTLGSKMVS